MPKSSTIAVLCFNTLFLNVISFRIWGQNERCQLLQGPNINKMPQERNWPALKNRLMLQVRFETIIYLSVFLSCNILAMCVCHLAFPHHSTNLGQTWCRHSPDQGSCIGYFVITCHALCFILLFFHQCDVCLCLSVCVSTYAFLHRSTDFDQTWCRHSPDQYRENIVYVLYYRREISKCHSEHKCSEIPDLAST